jgi:hypothetical protein
VTNCAGAAVATEANSNAVDAPFPGADVGLRRDESSGIGELEVKAAARRCVEGLTDWALGDEAAMSMAARNYWWHWCMFSNWEGNCQHYLGRKMTVGYIQWKNKTNLQQSASPKELKVITYSCKARGSRRPGKIRQKPNHRFEEQNANGKKIKIESERTQKGIRSALRRWTTVGRVFLKSVSRILSPSMAVDASCS